MATIIIFALGLFILSILLGLALGFVRICLFPFKVAYNIIVFVLSIVVIIFAKILKCTRWMLGKYAKWFDVHFAYKWSEENTNVNINSKQEIL